MSELQHPPAGPDRKRRQSGAYQEQRSGKTQTGWSVFIRYGQWYSYGIHPGEDWNGAGQGNSDEGQPDFSRIFDSLPLGAMVIIF